MRTLVLTLAILLVAPSAWGRPRCVERSDVVGEEVCTRYGDGWSIEHQFPITFRFGFRYAEVGPAGHSFREAFKASRRPKNYVGYRFPGAALGTSSLSGAGADGGFVINLVGQLYLGIEGGLLLGSAATKMVATSTYLLSNDSGADVALFHAGAPIGYRLPLGRFSLRGEMLFGVTFVDVTQVARPLSDLSQAGVRMATATIGLIEPRVAGDIWFTQHIAFSVYGGANILDANGRAFGISLAFHSRAFDGDATFW